MVQPDPDSPFARDNRAEAVLGRIGDAAGSLRLWVNEARAQKDVVKLNCLNDKTIQVLALERGARDARNSLRTSSIGDDGAGDKAWERLVGYEQRARQLKVEAMQCIGEEAAYGGRAEYRINGPIANARVARQESESGDTREPSRAERRLAEIGAQTDRRKGEVARTRARIALERETVLAGGTNEKPKDVDLPQSGIEDQTVSFSGQNAPDNAGGIARKAPAGAPAGGQTATAPVTPTVPAPATVAPAHDGSLLIRSAQLALAVFEVDKNVDAVEKIALEAGGYLALRGDRQITIRIPKGRFDESVKRIEKLGDVLHRNIAAEDVTDQYVDLEMRLKNAHAVRARLEKLLEAATVKDAVEIQKELAKVTEEIERYEGKLKLLRDRVAFATITVSFEQQQNQQVKTQALLPFPWMSVLGLQPLLYVPR